MTAVILPLLALVSGWGWSTLPLPGGSGANRVADATVLAVAVVGGWLFFLDGAGIRWTAAAVAAGLLPGLVLGLTSSVRRLETAAPGSGPRQHRQLLSSWGALATAAVGLRALAVAAVPAHGWDFRYIWGLKARVFIAAGSHDLHWLAQPAHSFAHPDYPPLWPDLVAAGGLAGAPAGQAAAWWGVLLAAGLGAACWRLARPAGPQAAALAAAAGAWFPTLQAPDVSHSGSAEPLAAFLFAAALVVFDRGRMEGRRPLIPAFALAALALTKNEGAVLALLLAAAAFFFLPRKTRVWPSVAVVLAVAAWQLTVTAAGIPRLGLILDAARMLSRAAAFPHALLSVLGPVLLLEIVLAAVLLAAPHVAGVRSLKVVLALWLAALGLAYLSSPHELAWHLETSLARVLAIPLPGALALLLGRGAAGAVDSRRSGQHNACSAPRWRKEEA